MKTLEAILVTLPLIFFVPALAQSDKRLSVSEIRGRVEDARKKILQERSHEARVKILEVLLKELREEVLKGAAVFDDTYVEAASLHTDIQVLARADCATSLKYASAVNIPAGSDAPSLKDRKAREYRLQLHSALCRKD